MGLGNKQVDIQGNWSSVRLGETLVQHCLGRQLHRLSAGACSKHPTHRH